MSEKDTPVLIELEADEAVESPADAPVVSDLEVPLEGQAMQVMASMAARPRSRLVGWFWRLLGALLVGLSSITLWDFVVGLIARNSVLGWAALGLVGAFVLVCLAIVLREWAALARLRRVEVLHERADRALAEDDLGLAKDLSGELVRLYRGREDMRWHLQRLEESREQVFDARAMLELTEDSLLRPLDEAAGQEVQAAARQVATVTALVPLAFADVLAALTANVRMIRRIAEIYGGRSGTLGSWRLTRAVMTHLVATGAVAVGDDLIGSLGGGHLLAKLSRRFGEGMINGALTARVGVAAMEVCRPIPFVSATKPKTSNLIRMALTGLFDRSKP